MRLAVYPGIPGGADDTDVRIRFSLSNVMRVSDLSEYTGELRASAQVRLTDREAPVAPDHQDFPLEFDVPCVPRRPIDKSLCDLATTLDTVMPGAAAEGTRAIWALDQVKVYDGGPDEDADTTGTTRCSRCRASSFPRRPLYPERPCWPPPTPSSARCT